MTETAMPSTADSDANAVWSRRQLLVLLAITLLAVLLRFWHLEQWSWNDAEVRTWRAITEPLASLLGSWRGAEPLVPIALRLLTGLGILPGHGEGWLRLPFAFVGVASVPLLVLALRPSIGARAALLAGLIAAVHGLAVRASQTIAASGVVLALALFAAVALQEGRRRPAWLAAGLGLAAGVPGWLALACIWSQHLGPVVRRRTLLGAAALAAVALPFTASALTLPLVVVAGVGAMHETRESLRWFTVLPLAGASLLRLVHVEHDALLVLALPGLSAFAAVGAMQLFAAARTTLRASPLAAATGAAMPAVVLVVWLGVDALLTVTVFHGGRPAWRAAADVVWGLGRSGESCTIGAASGLGSLTCYLRPHHWQGDAVDPHPQRRLLPFDVANAGPALAALVACADPCVLLVLRSAEVEGLAAPARAELDRAFPIAQVVATPRACGDDSICIYRRRPPP